MAPAEPAYFVGSEVSNTTFPAIGLLKFAWFRMLKASALNCKFNLSFRGIRLNNDMSRFQNSGPVNLPRDTLPNVPVGGSRKALGSKYRPVFLNPSTPKITFPLKSGFMRGTSGMRVSPFPDWLKPTTGVMGNPLWALKMPFHCQLLISPAELRIVRVPERRRVIIGRGTEDGGTDVRYLPPGVIGLETQSASGTLGQRDIRSMVPSGSHIDPGVGGSEKRVRTHYSGDVFGSLRDGDAEPGRPHSAAGACRGVVAYQRFNRIQIHRGREVIGLVAHIAELYREV